MTVEGRCAHLLYSLKNPRHLINKMYKYLKPEGLVWACDIRRQLKLLDWTRYHFHTLTKRMP